MARKQTLKSELASSGVSPVSNRRVSTRRSKPAAPAAEPANPPAEPTREAIAALAYSYWEGRGCQGGCAEEDWVRAEHELRAATAGTAV